MSNNADWWARKLGNAPASKPSTPAPVRPAPVQSVYALPTAPAAPQMQQAPTPEQTAASKSLAAKQTGACPSCGSGNYMRPLGHPNAPERCFDCGYPIVQSTSGMSGTGDPQTPVQPARQPSMGSGFNPQIIVDRIG